MTARLKPRLAAVALASLLVAGCATLPAPTTEQWAGQVQPADGWLIRQGVERSYPIAFVIDTADRATGTFTFVPSTYPAVSGPAALEGRRDPDGSAFYLSAEVRPKADLPAKALGQAAVAVALTGFDEEDGSLRGVGTIDMADLACLKDPSRAATGETCARRKVPVKWTARPSGGARP